MPKVISRALLFPKRLRTRSPRKLLDEMEVFDRFVRDVQERGLEGLYEKYSLENYLHWAVELSSLLNRAYSLFDEVNQKHFEGKLRKPVIGFVARTTGGFYRYTDNTIGISLAMTIEHGETEFFETVLHEVAHMAVRSHSPKFYDVLNQIGGSGRKAPPTIILLAKRKTFSETHYPVLAGCPGCGRQQRYKTRHGLQYACRACCNKHNSGKFDARFRLVEITPEASLPTPVLSHSNI